jgi:FtsZ-interacting cell division protein ZipA
MQTFLIVLSFGFLVLIGLLILGVVRNRGQKAKFQQIAKAQKKRTKLSDLEFCKSLSLLPEDLPAVSAIRKSSRSEALTIPS